MGLRMTADGGASERVLRFFLKKTDRYLIGQGSGTILRLFRSGRRRSFASLRFASLHRAKNAWAKKYTVAPVCCAV